jgi:hypothetical protein
MPSDIGDLLLKIYCDRNGTVLENGVVDNVDQTVTLLKCMEFAKLNNNEELIDHCEEWFLTVFGPSEDDSAAINEWLQESNTLGDIINQGAINETIDVYLWQAIRAAYYCGADDPFEFIKLRLKETKNHWNVVKALYDDEIKLHGRSL